MAEALRCAAGFFEFQYIDSFISIWYKLATLILLFRRCFMARRFVYVILIFSLAFLGACSSYSRDAESIQYASQLNGTWESPFTDAIPLRLEIRVHDMDNVFVSVIQRNFRRGSGVGWWTDGYAWGSFDGKTLLLNVRWGNGSDGRMRFTYSFGRMLCNSSKRCLQKVL